MLKLIKIDAAKEGMILAKNVYDNNGNLLISSGSLLKESYIEKLKSSGKTSLYVGSLSEGSELPEPISETLRLKTAKTLKGIAESIRTGNKTVDLSQVKHLAEQIIKEFEQDANTCIVTTDPKDIDDYVYRHSVNTCLISLVLAKSMFLSKERVKTLAIGALLHDIGTAFVPKEILEKRSSLNKEELFKVREHSRFGYVFLSRFKTVNLFTRHIAYQHHERADGSGYPRGLKNGQIDPLAKIVSIADVFDAMTSDKPYKKAMRNSEAIKELSEDTHLFDQQIVSILLKSIAPFTLGEKVQLNNGESAYVLRVNPREIDKPLVSVERAKKQLIIDLKKQGTYEIISA